MKTANRIKRSTGSFVITLALGLVVGLATSCSREQTGKDDGTGTIMDDGTTNKHRGSDTTINTLRVDSVR
jgi:hypothetical protein